MHIGCHRDLCAVSGQHGVIQLFGAARVRNGGTAGFNLLAQVRVKLKGDLQGIIFKKGGVLRCVLCHGDFDLKRAAFAG
ncbi:hypothetical protein SDC9_207228 [bioreactor metagenome]|uniref:Uncharacterized protein n=1 Tax=bioreactor metagenome TaxID=1076179 RepID=A0A645J7Y1_9ZZZZ